MAGSPDAFTPMNNTFIDDAIVELNAQYIAATEKAIICRQQCQHALQALDPGSQNKTTAREQSKSLQELEMAFKIANDARRDADEEESSALDALNKAMAVKGMKCVAFERRTASVKNIKTGFSTWQSQRLKMSTLSLNQEIPGGEGMSIIAGAGAGAGLTRR